jgi:hypothetical protein
MFNASATNRGFALQPSCRAAPLFGLETPSVHAPKNKTTGLQDGSHAKTLYMAL